MRKIPTMILLLFCSIFIVGTGASAGVYDQTDISIEEAIIKYSTQQEALNNEEIQNVSTSTPQQSSETVTPYIPGEKNTGVHGIITEKTNMVAEQYTPSAKNPNKNS